MTEPFLTDCWYVAGPSKLLKTGSMLPLTVLGQQVLLARTKEGKAFALRDFCPHRGLPLRFGTFDGCEIECCYHGWRFNAEGTCTKVPTLLPDDPTDLSRIRTGSFPVRESHGLMWIFVAAAGKIPEPPSLPSLPDAVRTPFRFIDTVLFPCPIDHAVIGLMDPSHGPFVHQSWWWRSRRSIHRKEKCFVPTERGFKMASHAPSSNSRAYKLLGGERKTEIAFQLPALRTEHIQVGSKNIVLLTALTPITATETQLHQFFYTDIPLLNFLLPLLKPFGKAFIRQDLEIVRKQQAGLAAYPNQPLLLLGDADAQARWYYRLRKEHTEAVQQERPFENKLKERTLRWQS